MMNFRWRFLYELVIAFCISCAAHAQDIGKHGEVQSGDVKIHYVERGKGPLVVMIHGFPDYWYTWRHQMQALSDDYRVVAIDQRGYNKSGQPEGAENYTMDRLVGDVKAVVDHFPDQTATIVGHDWGGIVAWSFAMKHPELTKRLIVLNAPHPHGIQRELSINPNQEANSQYARQFQNPNSHQFLTAEGIAGWVKNKDDRQKYVAAFKRSSLKAMMHYYQQNYPSQPYKVPTSDPPPVKCPVLMIHGLEDTYLLAECMNGTWRWVDAELRIVTIPRASHFVQHDAAGRVSSIMRGWLQSDPK